MPIAPGTSAPPLPADVALPAVLAFFKASCPVCQMAFPLYGELARRIDGQAAVVAVSQDPPSVAGPWLAQRSFEGPALDDEKDHYALSDAYGIRSVPTLVVIEPDGTVGAVAEGWDRDATNAIAARFGAEPVSTPDDGLPAFKPG